MGPVSGGRGDGEASCAYPTSLGRLGLSSRLGPFLGHRFLWRGLIEPNIIVRSIMGTKSQETWPTHSWTAVAFAERQTYTANDICRSLQALRRRSPTAGVERAGPLSRNIPNYFGKLSDDISYLCFRLGFLIFLTNFYFSFFIFLSSFLLFL